MEEQFKELDIQATILNVVEQAGTGDLVLLPLDKWVNLVEVIQDLKDDALNDKLDEMDIKIYPITIYKKGEEVNE